MRLHVKIGTLPATYVYTRKRNPPRVGDVIEARELEPGIKSIRIRCTQIKDLNGDALYYMDL